MEELSNEDRIAQAKKKAAPLNVEMHGERVVYLNIEILPKNKIGKLIIPETVKDVENVRYDQHPKQGIIVALGPEAKAKGLKLLSHVYIREMSAAFMVHEGQAYGVVYSGDILCTIPK